ncbi:MAG: MFS transporter [Saprospiraceae bacterium]|nr:MFS transporter [Saprospiraceae bacterium]
MQSTTIKRIAVSVFFFIYGFNLANLSSRLPELKKVYGISDSKLGVILLCIAVGNMTIATFLSKKHLPFERKTILLMAIVVGSGMMMLAPIINGDWLTFPLFFIYGMTDGAKDIIMNEQAVVLESQYKKPLMSSFHAIGTMGLFVGASTGLEFVHLGLDLFHHFAIIALLCLVILLVGIPYLFMHSKTISQEVDTTTPSLSWSKISLLLGGIAFCAMLGDSAMNDWAGIYTEQVLKAGATSATLAYTIFISGVTLGRLLGDRLRAKFGNYSLLFWNTIVTLIGLSTLILATQLQTALLGFFMTGLGISTIVPLVYSIAGHWVSTNPSVSIAKISQLGYAAYFAAPLVIGFLGDIGSLRWGFGFVLCCSIGMIVLIRQLKTV